MEKVTTLEAEKAIYERKLRQLALTNPYAQKVSSELYRPNPLQQVVEDSIYAIKPVSSLTSFDDLFKSDDKIRIGLTNISEGKLPSDWIFLAHSISLQYGVAASTSADDLAKTEFGLIHPYMRNGEIRIVQNNTEILPQQNAEKYFTARHFVSMGNNNPEAGNVLVNVMRAVGRVGRVRLENSKFLFGDRKIDVSLKFSAPMPANSVVKIILHGMRNAKY